MDWFSILLIVIFFLFPLIQSALERARQPEVGSPIESEPAEGGRESGGVQTADTGRVPPKPESWSDGWAQWPTPPVKSEEEANRAARREEPMSWRMPPSLPEILPPVAPKRKLVAAEERIGESPAKARMARAALREASRSTGPPVAREPAIVQQLSGRAALRRAIVLREVLGPPVALRSADRDPVQ